MAYKIVALKSVVSTPEGKKYKICEFGYRTEDGKVKAMRLFGFGDQKGNFDVAAKATNGEHYEAEFQQNDKGYWEFKPDSLKATGTKEATPAVTASAKGGTWETPDERAARQVMIVRQSSLSNAIAFLELVKSTKSTEEEVVNLAKYFEAYVLDKSVDPEVTGDVE